MSGTPAKGTPAKGTPAKSSQSNQSEPTESTPLRWGQKGRQPTGSQANVVVESSDPVSASSPAVAVMGPPATSPYAGGKFASAP